MPSFDTAATPADTLQPGDRVQPLSVFHGTWTVVAVHHHNGVEHADVQPIVDGTPQGETTTYRADALARLVTLQPRRPVDEASAPAPAL